MKKNSLLLCLLISVLFAGCDSLMDKVVTGAAGSYGVNPEEAAVLTLRVNRFSPGLETLFNPGGTAVPDRAMWLADRVEIGIRKSGETAYLQEEVYEAGHFGSGYDRVSLTLEKGFDYVVEAEVYNLTVSETVPVVRGSRTIPITHAGLYDMDISCFPLPSEEEGSLTRTLEQGTPSATLNHDNLTPVSADILTDKYPSQMGEQWFEVTGITTGATRFTVLPEDESRFGFYFEVYDSQNNHYRSGGFDPQHPDEAYLHDLVIPTVPGETYYLVVLSGEVTVGGDSFAQDCPFQVYCEPWTVEEEGAFDLAGSGYGYTYGSGVFEATFSETQYVFDYLDNPGSLTGTADLLFYNQDTSEAMIEYVDASMDLSFMGPFNAFNWENREGYTTMTISQYDNAPEAWNNLPSGNIDPAIIFPDAVETVKTTAAIQDFYDGLYGAFESHSVETFEESLSPMYLFDGRLKSDKKNDALEFGLDDTSVTFSGLTVSVTNVVFQGPFARTEYTLTAYVNGELINDEELMSEGDFNYLVYSNGRWQAYGNQNPDSAP